MFRVTLLVLACLAFSAQANNCCGSHYERADCCNRHSEYMMVEPVASTTECVEESEPLQEIEEVEQVYDEPAPAAPYYAPTPAPPAPKITIEISQVPQPVTEPAIAPTPAHYEAPAAPQIAYMEEKKIVPVRLERVVQHHAQRMMHVRPVHHQARYVAVQESSPCDSTCHASVGCCK